MVYAIGGLDEDGGPDVIDDDDDEDF